MSTEFLARLAQFDKRWLGVGLAAAGAGTGVVVAPQAADAAISYHPAVNLNIPTTTAGIYLNVVTGVSATTPGGSPGWDLNPWGSASWNIWANNGASPNDGIIINYTGGSSTTLMDNLPFGASIDGTWAYGRTNSVESTGPTAFVLNSSNNLYGFRFLDEAAQCLKFGWARVSLSGTQSSQPRTLTEYAYENTCGVAILAGVPEPASMSLLALGAAGVLIRRRRN